MKNRLHTISMGVAYILLSIATNAVLSGDGQSNGAPEIAQQTAYQPSER